MRTSLPKAAAPQRRSRFNGNVRARPKPPSSGHQPRRQFLHHAAGAAALPLVSRIAWAQAYPSRPITMIVPFAAGGTTDVLGRIVAERIGKYLGQPVIVENVAGAAGNIGVGRAVHATPDGYTIALGNTSTHVLNGAFYSLPYDVLNDFAPISPLTTISFFLFARKTMRARDLNELIDWLKANPEKASIGSAVVSDRLLALLFQKETGTQFAIVPYRGIAPAMQDLVAGQIDLLIGPPDLLPLVRAGSIKAFAVTSEARSPLAPGIPSFSEMGLPALFWSGWFGLFTRKGTPRDIIDKLNSAVVEALADPAVRLRLVELGLDIFPRERQTSEALAAMQKADAEKWWPIIRNWG
jgi:tripartite-type tricarboxylate transporter receptor subunit TctC